MIRQKNVGNRTKVDELRISRDICYVRMTGIARELTIYGHRANLSNNNSGYKGSFAGPKGGERSPIHIEIGETDENWA